MEHSTNFSKFKNLIEKVEQVVVKHREPGVGEK